MNAHWFRSDLRINDNPALNACIENGISIAIYALAESQWEAHDVSQAKRSFIIRNLFSLEAELEKLNIPLIVLNVGDFNNAPALLRECCRKYNINHLFFNYEYELNERKYTKNTVNLLENCGVTVSAFHDQCIVPPGSIRKPDGECYKVFSAFKRAFFKNLLLLKRPISKAPPIQQQRPHPSDISALKNVKINSSWDKYWPAGEKSAYSKLNEFSGTAISIYDQTRDSPSTEGTSTLSPWLAVGALSTRQCLDAIESRYSIVEGDNNAGITSWLNELIWREFYRHLIYAFPDLCRHKPFKPETDQLPWKHDKALFTKWCNGETGYPIVDAAMCQLREKAWMHNRLRMVTAMFLCKHLFIDWRLGEKYFMQNLIDGDFASNNGGWQWSASTGVDAVPYFRIFNPTRQSQRFDADGTFIRRYVPALSKLDNKSIHQPSAEQIRASHYVDPIVDHKTAVESTKSWFKSLSNTTPLN